MRPTWSTASSIRGESVFLGRGGALGWSKVVEVDEKLMEQYLEKGRDRPGPHAPFGALREGRLIPRLTSARNGAGVEALLDIFAKLAPNDRGQRAAVLRAKGRRRSSSRCRGEARAGTCSGRSIPSSARWDLPRAPGDDDELAAFHRQRQAAVQGGAPVRDQGKDYVETDALMPGTSAR
jgi:hypothetical protein